MAVLGGSDAVAVEDLTGTGVQEVSGNLAAAPGGTAPDAGSDRLTLDGTSGEDFPNVFGTGTGTGAAAVLGLPVFVQVRHADPARDRLTVRGLAGDDSIEAGGTALAFELVQDGGSGDDGLFGSSAADVKIGGDGDDFADGRRGDDNVRLGAGDDIFTADADDGSDTVEGDAGRDNLRSNGSSAGERFDVARAGERVRIERDPGGVLDAHGVELVGLLSFGGADRVNVGDLTATGVTDLDVNVFDFGVPGGATDVVRVDATSGDDAITVAAGGGAVSVTGAPATLRLTGATAANDRLEINGLAVADSVDSLALPATASQFLAEGGAGDDVLLGDDDVLIGGAGDDVLLNGEVVFDD